VQIIDKQGVNKSITTGPTSPTPPHHRQLAPIHMALAFVIRLTRRHEELRRVKFKFKVRKFYGAF